MSFKFGITSQLTCLFLATWSVAKDELNPIVTDIEVHPNKRICAGDDIIVFGTGGFSGVDYMIPSARDKKPRGLANGNEFHASSFAVAGKKIALVNNFAVTVFDTRTQSAIDIPIEQLRLTTVPGPLHAPGHMHSDGRFVICRSDKSTKDQRFVKIIDVRGDTPKLISFAENPPVIRADFITHVLVDSKMNTAVAATQESFFVYDIRKTGAEPFEIKIPTGMADLPPQIDGNMILFQNREAHPKTMLLNVSTKEIVTFKLNPSAGVLQLVNGSFAYFVNTNSNDWAGNGIRSVIGNVDKLNEVKLAPERRFINGRTANHGAIGYGETVAISPNGSLWFLGGLTSVGSGEYLQVSEGGDFRLLPDPLGKDEHGCYATDVTLCKTTVAFKTKGKERGTSYLGYVLLNQ